MSDQRTLADLANEALDIQCATNLAAIAPAFSRAMSRLRELFPNKRAGFYNTHPIAVLWTDKLKELTEAYSIGVTEAYMWAKRTTRQAKAEFEAREKQQSTEGDTEVLR